VAKEVVVDGRRSCPNGDCRDRMVEFDVVLFADGGTEAMRFAAPVGHIGFRSTNGRPQVKHHYDMVPVSSLMAMEE
jgi:hypothetical protein